MENEQLTIAHWISHAMQEAVREVMATPPKRLLTVKESATYLNKSQDSVRSLIYGHKIPVIQKGERGKILVDIKDLDKWIERNKAMSGDPGR